jgi:hypothetical protein
MSAFRKFEPRVFRESSGAAKAADPAKTTKPRANLSSFSNLSGEPDPTEVTGPAARTLTAAQNRSAARQATSAEWSVEDWQVFFDERAAIAEFDGRIPRDEAEARAFACCVVEWMNRHPAPSAPGRCAWCGRAESPGAVVLPFGTEPGMHTWLHAECWPDWHKARQADAIAALAAMGIARGE